MLTRRSSLTRFVFASILLVSSVFQFQQLTLVHAAILDNCEDVGEYWSCYVPGCNVNTYEWCAQCIDSCVSGYGCWGEGCVYSCTTATKDDFQYCADHCCR